MKTCGASNLPRTCLWCGIKLRSWSPERSLAGRLRRARLLPGGERRAQEILEFHAKYKDRYGYTPGLFCTGACAMAFGIAAARGGFRFASVERVVPVTHAGHPARMGKR